MGSESVAGELVAIAGRAAGGALTAEDLSAVRPEVLSCDARRLAPGGVLRVPWEGASLDASGPRRSSPRPIGRGLVAIACYELAVEGVPVPALGLVAPPMAAPVMRGEARVRPGEALPAPAPIALLARKGLVELALGVSGAPGAEAALVALLGKLSDETPLVADMLAGVQGHPVALVRTREAARVVVSAG